MKLEEGSVCPVCEVGKMEKKTKDQKFTYQGYSITFHDCEVFVCSVCGEGFFPKGTESMIDNTLTAHRKALHDHMGVQPL